MLIHRTICCVSFYFRSSCFSLSRAASCIIAAFEILVKWHKTEFESRAGKTKTFFIFNHPTWRRSLRSSKLASLRHSTSWLISTAQSPRLECMAWRKTQITIKKEPSKRVQVSYGPLWDLFRLNFRLSFFLFLTAKYFCASWRSMRKTFRRGGAVWVLRNDN